MNNIKTITISDKGQISIPKSFRKIIGLDKGDTLVITIRNKKIIMQKSDDVFEDLFNKDKIYLTSEKALNKYWDNDADKRWNKY